MVVNVGAYGIEIVRAGIDAIPRGQIEAGFALGLKRLRDLPVRHHPPGAA